MTISYTDRINQRRLILGPSDNLMAISPMKHTWARDLWKRMLANTWFPSEVNLSDDVVCYRDRLTAAERFMFDKALAFLSNLDGIQFNNLTQNISKHVTSPEVSMIYSRQAFEEALHVDSYAAMIEAISLDPMSVYMTFERDGLLAEKNEHVLKQSQILGNNLTPHNFALALVSNILLEGVYFFSGFLAFYVLGRNGKMLGSCDMIRLINRDEEQTHLDFFLHQLETMKIENPEVFTAAFWAEAQQIVINGVEMEMKWGKYIISGGVLGLSDEIVERYIKSLGNKRAIEMGMDIPYPNVTNPIPWVEDMSRINGTEKNFFETKPTDYSVGGALEW